MQCEGPLLFRANLILWTFNFAYANQLFKILSQSKLLSRLNHFQFFIHARQDLQPNKKEMQNIYVRMWF